MSSILKRLLKCPQGGELIIVWRQVIGEYALGQTQTITKISIGRYVVLKWTTFNTPFIGSD